MATSEDVAHVRRGAALNGPYLRVEKNTTDLVRGSGTKKRESCVLCRVAVCVKTMLRHFVWRDDFVAVCHFAFGGVRKTPLAYL